MDGWSRLRPRGYVARPLQPAKTQKTTSSDDRQHSTYMYMSGFRSASAAALRKHSRGRPSGLRVATQRIRMNGHS